MPIDLAIDISRKSSGLVWDSTSGGCPHSNTFTAPSVEKAGGGGYPMGKTLARYRQMLVETIQVVQPDRITFEAPLHIGGNKESTTKTSHLTIRLLFGLATITEEVAFAMDDIPCFEVSVQTCRKHFVGNGHAEKEDVLARCHQLGWMFTSTDISDAAAVWWTAKVMADPRWRPEGGLTLFQERNRR